MLLQPEVQESLGDFDFCAGKFLPLVSLSEVPFSQPYIDCLQSLAP
jgi:hypothetical protein